MASVGPGSKFCNDMMAKFNNEAGIAHLKTTQARANSFGRIWDSSDDQFYNLWKVCHLENRAHWPFVVNCLYGGRITRRGLEERNKWT